MKCKICGVLSDVLFNSTILGKYHVDYYQCMNCGFIQTGEPYWLEEAYGRPINNCDTGILQRNISLSKITALIISRFFDKNSKALDYAGGYGIFVRLMRDKGFDFYWYDKYTKNLLVNGFEFTDQKVDFVTAFEAFEHFADPIDEIKKIMEHGKVGLLFSTNIYSNELVQKPKDWWYYGFEHGQHIALYSRKTLEYIAKQFNMYYYFINEGLHLFSPKRINRLAVLILPVLIKIMTRRYFTYGLKSRTFEDMLLTAKLDSK